jgi:integrase
MKELSSEVIETPSIEAVPHNNSKRRRLERKPIVLHEGNATVTIRYEKPRGNRSSYRLESLENGKKCSEMYESLEEAKTAGEIKLKSLAAGKQVLTKEEIANFFEFKTKLEDFEKQLSVTGRSLQQVVSDVIAASEVLPGWTSGAMAEFIRQNHGITNPMMVDAVVKSYIAHLESGYKRDYADQYLSSARNYLEEFVAAFPTIRIDQINPKDILNFINKLRVKPRNRSNKTIIGEDGLVPANQKTKKNVFSHLNQLLDYSKKVLKALPARLDTVTQLLDAPQFTKAVPETYTPGELIRLFSAMPTVECVLFISLQLFAGLRPCEAGKFSSAQIKHDENGNLSHISVTRNIAKKDSTSGCNRPAARPAPITPPLARLLAIILLPDSNGEPLFPSDIATQVQDAAAKANIKWKHDALRHSFITYRLAVVKNRGTVAYEAGHSIPAQIAHYEGLIEDAKDVSLYWNFVINTEGMSYSSQSKNDSKKSSQATEVDESEPLSKAA